MAITWTNHKWDSATQTSTVIGRRTSHDGLVVSAEFGRDERIMSDVWAWLTYVKVWNPTEAKVENVCLRDDGAPCGECGSAEQDASPEVLALAAAYETRVKAEAEAREAAEVARRTAEARVAEHNRPMHGKVMQVVKGRKVPHGTVGRVFWVGLDNYGKTKVGLATSERKDADGRNVDVVWTAASNCVNAEPLNEPTSTAPRSEVRA